MDGVGYSSVRLATTSADCEPGSEIAEVEGQWRCTLEALRDRTPGIIVINVNSASEDCGYSDELVSLGDGTAIFWRYEGHTPPPRRVVLREPAYFDACAASDEPSAIIPCLLDWYESETCEPVTCCPAQVYEFDVPACGD
jgi:hypothetical protein